MVWSAASPRRRLAVVAPPPECQRHAAVRLRAAAPLPDPKYTPIRSTSTTFPTQQHLARRTHTYSTPNRENRQRSTASAQVKKKIGACPSPLDRRSANRQRRAGDPYKKSICRILASLVLASFNMKWLENRVCCSSSFKLCGHGMWAAEGGVSLGSIGHDLHASSPNSPKSRKNACGKKLFMLPSNCTESAVHESNFPIPGPDARGDSNWRRSIADAGQKLAVRGSSLLLHRL